VNTLNTSNINSTFARAIANVKKVLLLANVNVHVHVRYRSSSVRLSVCLSVVCLSVTFVHPTQAVEILGSVSTPLYVAPNPQRVVAQKRSVQNLNNKP